jgi:predicted MFS family arabinose efflux permease
MQGAAAKCMPRIRELPTRGAAVTATAAPPAVAVTPVRATALGTMSTVLGVLPVFLLGGLSVLVGDELGFGESALGVAVAAYFLTSAVTSVPVGRLTERIGARRATIVSGTASAVLLAAIGLFSTGWGVLVVLLLLAGAANAMSQLSANVWVAHAVPPAHRGLAFGIKQSAIPMGTLVAGASLPLVGLTLGWRAAFIGAGILGALIVAVLLPRASAAPAAAARRGELGMSMTALVLLAVSGGMGAAAANSLAAFLVTSLVGCCMTAQAAGVLLVIGSAAGITGRVAAGAYIDHRAGGEVALVAVMMALGAVAIGLIGVADTMAFAAAAVIVAFAAGWGWNGLLNAAVVRLNPDAPAVATGVTQMGLYIGAVAGPPVFGVVFERIGPDPAWFGAAAALLLGSALALVAVRHRKRNPDS